jgi:hypothetical protein
MLPWRAMIPFLVNQNVGVSLTNGQGVAGKLCSYDSNSIYLLQYLYQQQFATMHYTYGEIQNVTPYPSCR